MSKKLKKALALGIGATLGAKLLGAKADAAKKLLASQQTDTGDFGTQMANDTNLIRGTSKALMGAKKTKPMGFLGKAKKFLSDEVFTTNPKTKAFTIPSLKGSKSSEDFGLTPYSGAKTGKMIKANSGMMVESRGNKLARSKLTKIS